MKTIFLIRHGQPILPDQQRRFIGQTDLEISERGIKQAHAIGRILKKQKIEMIYSSDLKRSVATAEIIAKEQALTLHPLTELREIDLGAWENTLFSDIARQFPKAFEERGRDIGYFKPPGGESFAELKMRAMKAFDMILSTDASKIVIVGHAGINRVILCSLLKIPLSNLFKITQDYGCINHLYGTPTDLRIKTLNMPSYQSKN